jgi:hypothetical protein
MPLAIQFKKGRNGPDVITCVRGDGTRTWERLQRSMAVHDLVHFAVESELGFARGFYGLLESGWSITTFLDRESRRELPAESGVVEYLVGQLWEQSMNGRRPEASEFNAALALIESTKPGLVLRKLSAQELERVRSRIDDLVARWHSLAPGETLELEFARSKSAV